MPTEPNFDAIIADRQYVKTIAEKIEGGTNLSAFRIVDAPPSHQAVMPAPAPARLLKHAEMRRVSIYPTLGSAHRAEFGQFGTPIPVARLMASMFAALPKRLSLLDAGAGVGSLTAAFVDEVLSRTVRPESLQVTAFELEPVLSEALRDTLKECGEACAAKGVNFGFEIITEDFIRFAALAEQENLGGGKLRYNCAIQNPPYHKLKSISEHRRLLRFAGIETSNLYSAFLALTVRLLARQGELVSISPRSFCNGPYFEPFRRDFLTKMALHRIHVFEARNKVFSEDDVLQENIIVHAVRGADTPTSVKITSSAGPDDETLAVRHSPYSQTVKPDNGCFIHVVSDDAGERAAASFAVLTSSLGSLGIDVATGRTVDFRVRECLRNVAGANTVPLLYPCHMKDGFIRWPLDGSRKPNALAVTRATHAMLHPSGWYVVVKRFSAKEEARRIVAAVVTPQSIGNAPLAVENHLNIFHARGRGLDADFAKGLAAFLNSTPVDLYFRQFSGHTQVNAADLRSLRYPASERLISLGQKIVGKFPAQDELDRLVSQELNAMARHTKNKRVSLARLLEPGFRFTALEDAMRHELGRKTR